MRTAHLACTQRRFQFGILLRTVVPWYRDEDTTKRGGAASASGPMLTCKHSSLCAWKVVYVRRHVNDECTLMYA